MESTFLQFCVDLSYFVILIFIFARMNRVILYCLMFSFTVSAQIRGKVVDSNNIPLAYVNIYLDDFITGTISNQKGEYELPFSEIGRQYIVVFKTLGYKTVKKKIYITSLPYTLNVKLEVEELILDEVVIKSDVNLADVIIRKTIKNKEKNLSKIEQYTADFYSKGIIRLKDVPKTFMGKDIGDLGGHLDANRTGVIYLSETVSNIAYQKEPFEFKENITASKVSGSDRGISFNNALSFNLSFYKNTVRLFGRQVTSPISSNAFSHYNYKLIGTFHDREGNLINKIEIVPKLDNTPVFSGFIYIVERDWSIYGADVLITGERVYNPILDTMRLKQNYNYSKEKKAWVVISKTIDFKLSFMGVKSTGKFSAVYSNYNFSPDFTADTFGDEILSFENDAHKKDTLYWNKLRPISLTKEEKIDYKRKDSIKTVRKSKKYLDSLDRKNNVPKWTDLLFMRYNYQNSYNKWYINTNLLIPFGFNTVQGWYITPNIKFHKSSYTKPNFTISSHFNYSFSERKLRPKINFNYQWDRINYSYFKFSAGITISQFDENEPISNTMNAITSLFFKENYMKIYEKQFAKMYFDRYIFNGVLIRTSLEYANRIPLVNTTNYSFVKRDYDYTSNNPRNPDDFSKSFESHRIWTTDISTMIRFGNKYMSYPGFRINLQTKKYPILILGYRKTFGSTYNKLHSDLFYAEVFQNMSLEDKGVFSYRIKLGSFLEQRNISFIDYVHPKANEIKFFSGNSLSQFRLLEYYKLSTNDKYTELHTRYNFKGFVVNKIPLLNKLSVHLVLEAKGFFVPKQLPYTEYSVGLNNIGFSTWKLLYVGYVLSYFGGQRKNGIVIGFTGLF